MAPNLQALMENGDCADLTLKCGNEEFKVHRCVVYPQSDVIRAACSGGFQEAETKEIQVSIGNEFVLSLFVDYLYMGDYDDETPLYLNRNEESGYVFLDDTTMLMANAYLYLLADYYQIPGLLNLSAAKFRTAMSHKIDLSDFHKVVSLMYGSDEAIFARELREYVNSAIVENAASLIKVDAFMEQCQQQPMMAAIVLPMLVEHYETRLKEQRESLRHLQH